MQEKEIRIEINVGSKAMRMIGRPAVISKIVNKVIMSLSLTLNCSPG